MTLISFRLEFYKEEGGVVRIYLKGTGKNYSTNETQEYCYDVLANALEIERFEELESFFKQHFNLQ